MSNINILFSSKSIRNTVASCDSLGIHYDITKEKDSDIITVRRWDKTTDQNVWVGQLKMYYFERDMIRIKEDGDFATLGTFVPRHGSIFSRYVAPPSYDMAN